ncbi:type II CRISPR RNA-guided endonuclease Cas9 [Sediminimonas qiaohouensis]|uniref:type II CRISPR RNA-guided endonuclease Cas9 n=1 Tax=Sediminimonas qiaohouensis TaxID=552061 RepID=UPI001FE15219|nr:type II CRISPR RNA-guided endonuclease Cas9 [Sediminimonas qiaohouensis]
MGEFMRLGLDIGTNSIGWWLYATDGENITEVIDGGVRIFSDGRDPKSKASLAVERRAARAMRRRRDRYVRRRASLMRKLADSGLMPADPAQAKALELLDPYALRATALDDALPLHQLGRALFHVNQRRGFKSNRKADRGDNESGTIKDATQRLDLEMALKGARSYGEFLHMRRMTAPDPRREPSVRTRLTVAQRGGPDAKEEAGYDFYPDRRHLEDEFTQIWEVQRHHHPDVLTDDLRAALYETIFYQRPLKEPEVGLCLFSGYGDVSSDERRLPKAHPLAQRRVLYETVNSLRITADGRQSRPLVLEERDAIIHALDNKKATKTLASMRLSLDAIGKVIKLAPGEKFTLETANRDSIACDPVRSSLRHDDRFGPTWSILDAQAQWQVISRIRAVQSDADFAELIDWLMQTYGLDRDHAVATANAPLPEGYGRIGETATRRILDALESDVLTYSEAVTACGWHHSDHRTGEVLEQLPYYGEILERHVIPGSFDHSRHDPVKQAAEYYGRITNPTVHIGLNQLRRLVNLIITVYGKPDQIVVELARELKQSEQQKAEINRKNRENRAAAMRRSAQLAECGKPDTGANRMLLRLYEDLGPAIGPRKCPYTGKPITATMVLNGECDVDHILPYSRTLDDSFANRTICLREANREKGNKTPWEAWGDTPQWEAISANLNSLPGNKKWRFAPDAMERFEGENSFLDRALVDTKYLSRLARTYLDALYTRGGHVWVVPGRLTEMLRRHWGLNSLLSDKEGASKAKNRTDHRHHAIDAAVVAATSRSLIKQIADSAKHDEQDGKSAEDIARSIPHPWEDFRNDISGQLERIIVSHRADHGCIDPASRRQGRDTTTGQLHNDTAYGIVDEQTVVSRSPLLALKPGDIEITTKGKNIRDSYLQSKLALVTKGKDGKAFEEALRNFAASDDKYRGIRHVRLIESLQSSARVEIDGPNGKPMKAYKGDSNHCYEIWRLPDGKTKAQVTTTFEAHAGSARRPHPAAKRLLRLFKRDMVAIEREGETVICYVQKFNQAGILFLAPHTESNGDARDRTAGDPFSLFRMSINTLVKAHIRRVYVDEMGRLRDPGPVA